MFIGSLIIFFVILIDFNRTLNNETLVQSERIEISETSDTYTLKINKAAMTDAGNYAIKLTNRLGEETKNSSVTVKCNKLISK